MATYKIKFHMIDGNVYDFSVDNQPDNMEEMIKTLTKNKYYAVITDGGNVGRMINNDNVTKFDITKET